MIVLELSHNCHLCLHVARYSPFLGSCLDFSKLPEFSIGTPDFPDRSATFIVQVDALKYRPEDGGVSLTGPRIKTRHSLSSDGLHPSFWPCPDLASPNLIFKLVIIYAGGFQNKNVF